MPEVKDFLLKIIILKQGLCCLKLFQSPKGSACSDTSFTWSSANEAPL